MAHEASALAWLLRIEETEVRAPCTLQVAQRPRPRSPAAGCPEQALLRTRQTELEHRISVSQALRQELEQNEELKVCGLLAPPV